MGQTLIVSGDTGAPLSVSGNSLMLGSACARMSDAATESTVGIPMPAPGTISGLAAGGVSSGAWAIALRKNAANANQAISNAAPADTTHTDAVLAGDVVDGMWGAGGGATQRVTAIYQASGGHWATYASVNSTTGNSYAAGSTGYPALSIAPAASATESSAQRKVGAPGTTSGLFAGISSNAATATSTAVFRKTGVTGAQTVAIGAGLTGRFRDATNSDAIAVGDLICGQLTVGAGGAISVQSVGLAFRSSATPNANDTWASGLASAATQFFSLYGASALSAAEAAQQIAHGFSTVLSRLGMLLTSNAATGTSTYVSRVNGVSGGQSVSMGAGLTGWFTDVSGTDTLGPTDKACGLMTPNGGSITPASLAVTQSPFFAVAAQASTAPTASIARGRVLQGAATQAGSLVRSTAKTVSAAAAAAASLVRQTSKSLTARYPGSVLSLEPLNASLSVMEGLGAYAPYLFVTPHDSQVVARIDTRLFPSASAYIDSLSLAGFDTQFGLGCVVFDHYLIVLPHASGGLAKLVVLQIDLDLWDEGPGSAVAELDLSTILAEDPRGPDLTAACSGGCVDADGWLYIGAGAAAKASAPGIPSLLRMGTGANFTADNVSMLDVSSLVDPGSGKSISGVSQPSFDGAALHAWCGYGDTTKVNQSSGLLRFDPANFTLAGVTASTPVDFVQEAFASAGASVFVAPGASTTTAGLSGPLYQLDATTLAQIASFDLVDTYGAAIATSPTCALYDTRRFIYVPPNSGTRMLVIDTWNPGEIDSFDLAAIDPTTTGGYNAICPDADGVYAYCLPFQSAPAGANCNLLRFRMRQPTDSFGAATQAASLGRQTSAIRSTTASVTTSLMRGRPLQAAANVVSTMLRGRQLQASATAAASLSRVTQLGLQALGATAAVLAVLVKILQLAPAFQVAARAIFKPKR